jgi:activator of HSP90 ATPase
MKRVRILLALTIMLMIAMPVAAAQQQEQKKKRRAGQLSPTARVMMTMTKLRSAWKELDLTEEQEAKAAKVREELRPKMKQVFEKLQEILTDEQTEAIKEAAEKARAAGKKDRALFQAIESSIKLTDEQQEKKAKVDKQLLKLQRQMMRQLRGLLTPEQQETLAKKMWPKRKRAAKKKAA